MGGTSEILFDYLRDIFYDPAKAALELDKLDPEYVTLGKGLIYFAQCFLQYHELAESLAKGDLSVPLPPPENELAAPLKSLHASLKHLTWQSQQVAKGDYKQHVDFMGEFANAFNEMIRQLSERQQKLEDEVELSESKTKALEQSYQLLSNITQYIPQQIFVVDAGTDEILLMNDTARHETENDSDYFAKLMETLAEHKAHDNINVEFQLTQNDIERYFRVSSYALAWINAEVMLVEDISAGKNQIKELETYAYRDTMTQLYNRFYGMQTLGAWLDEKISFALIFMDLDNLKHINDKYGHGEGDKYIITAAKYLGTFSRDAVVCRVGGDEFMLLVPNVGFDEVNSRMNDISNAVQNDEYLKDKDYFYSISFGVIDVRADTKLSSSDILSIADERMYEYKRMRKKNRGSLMAE